mmetsp:Transcript_50292/g.155833  ORF Transcript_50292/g.155833 Transcript_50292/m.155833 type:complete len:275 (-) Transcript_50292:1076-1900(-)
MTPSVPCLCGRGGRRDSPHHGAARQLPRSPWRQKQVVAAVGGGGTGDKAGAGPAVRLAARRLHGRRQRGAGRRGLPRSRRVPCLRSSGVTHCAPGLGTHGASLQVRGDTVSQRSAAQEAQGAANGRKHHGTSAASDGCAHGYAEAEGEDGRDHAAGSPHGPASKHPRGRPARAKDHGAPGCRAGGCLKLAVGGGLAGGGCEVREDAAEGPLAAGAATAPVPGADLRTLTCGWLRRRVRLPIVLQDVRHEVCSEGLGLRNCRGDLRARGQPVGRA